MPLGNAAGNALALLLFNNDAFANVGDAAGLLPSAADGNLYLALHTADPGLGGAQNASEADYGSYARVALSRNGAAAMTVTGKVVTLVANATFPARTSGSNVLTHASIGLLVSGAGVIIATGALTPNLTIDATVTTPIINAAQTTFTFI